MAHGLLSEVCACIVVLYIIHRTGDSWAQFGITYPRLSDLVLALVVLSLSFVVITVWKRLTPFLVTVGFGAAYTEAWGPQGAFDNVLMAVCYLVGAFEEELGYRAYLVIRLGLLLQSPVKAVWLSSFLFALAHCDMSLAVMSDTMLGGLLYGFLYLGLRRIWPLVLGHTLWNVAATLQLW
jgi:membrane protease YdiL (CAAX protease family)